ncbi:MAG: fatty acid--CoA ligase [Thermoleophilia bacterium]|jgi:fatty-acyl-CoA synthase|nr:fatty acid--CoA ligase [Thermoleophilia bacterium]
MPPKPIVRTPSAYGYPLLLKHLLHAPLAHSADQEIVYRDFARYTYAEFADRLARLARGLHGLGVEPGQTVGVMDWDSHRYLECFFAVPMMGAVLHTVNVRLSPEQILYTIDHAADDVLLVNAEFLPVLEQIRDRLTTVKRVVLLSDLAETPETGVPLAAEYEALLAASAGGHDFPDFDEDTCATTFYTTGTTGLPKGVYYSHRQLVLHTLAGLSAMAMAPRQGGFHRDDVYMPITPMFHAHAWGYPYMATLMGVKQVYPGRYDPAVLLGLIQKEGVTVSHCVATIVFMLLQSPAIERADLSRWKVIIGGGPLPRALCREALSRGIDIWGGYGLSETCPFITSAHLSPEMTGLDEERELDIRCRAGRPNPLVDLRVVDEEMHDLPHDGASTGEIVLRAPWVTMGYLKDESSSEALWAGGYLHTGDLGFIDELGYLQVSDRIKDVIKTGGEWISSLDLENVIGQHPAVSEVAVIGVPDEKWGERPMALVVPKRGAPDDPEAIRAFVRGYAERGEISRYAVPDRVLFVGELDRTSVGKLDKRALRRRYAR